MNSYAISIIAKNMEYATNLIKKANRYVEMCSLLVDCDDYRQVDACFAWIEHSDKTPQEIYSEVFE